MASSSSASHHTRSNSLQSRPNSLVSQVDEQLSRLRSSESASCSTSSINSKLSRLSNLYFSIDEFLQLPSSQKALSCKGQEKWAEDALEGSIKLLDICCNINDVLMQMKQHAQETQSILRRRCSKDEITKEVSEYLRSRKKAMKALSKALKDLKKIKNKNVMDSNEMTDAISRLGECQMVTLSVLESVLVAMVGSKAGLQKSSWESAFSKLLKSKRIASQQETELFLVGFEATDDTLHPEKVMSAMENMEICIKNVEQGIERLFRHLIKTRTTILNILNC